MKPGLRQWLTEKISDTGLLNGRVYSIQEIDNVEKPYAVVTEIEEKIRRDSMSTFVDVKISVSVFDGELSVAENIAEAIKTKLQVPGETQNFWVLAIRQLSGRTKRNRLNYQVSTDFLINLQEK